MAEAMNALYKADVIYHFGPWPWFGEVEYATLEWDAWYHIHC